MENFTSVKAVSFGEEKSVQEIEQELLTKHEEQQTTEQEQEPVRIEEPIVPQQRELEENDVLSFIKNTFFIFRNLCMWKWNTML